MVSSAKCFLIFFVGLSVNNIAFGYDTQYCWSQTCRECPSSKEQGPGEQIKCDLSGIVNVDWLNFHRPQLPNNYGNQLADFACIKMVATDPTKSYDSTDIVRGCVIAQSAQTICDGLKATELARGKSDVTCHHCTGDYCNGSKAITASLILLFVSFIMSKIISS